MDFFRIIFDEKLCKSIETKACELISLSDLPLKNNIFKLAEQHAILILFPLNDTCDGFYVERHINGTMKKFIFINTKKPLHEQIFTTAHELGHALKIDEINGASCTNKEDINDRFAAEILLPKKMFVSDWEEFKRLHVSPKNAIEVKDFIKYIYDIMKKYFVDYETVFYRLVELKLLSVSNMNKLFSIMTIEDIGKKICEYLAADNSNLNSPTEKKYITNFNNIASMHSNDDNKITINKLAKILDIDLTADKDTNLQFNF